MSAMVGGDALDDWYDDGPKAVSTVLIATKATPPLEYPSLPAWVQEWLIPHWRHRLRTNETQWCAYWWKHAEAIHRLEAVWEAYEVMRQLDAPSLSVWTKDHLDPHMAALTSPVGPFLRCDAERDIHEQLPLWPTHEPPAGIFHDASATHGQENT